MSSNKTVVLGVCGGIAAYKALDVVSQLKKMHYEVHVIMTKSAAEFVTPLSFQSLSQNAVITNMFDEPKVFEIQHISLAKKADLMVIVPATANIIGKVANGIADDMLSTTIMATTAPVIFAPAMNTNMYNNIIVKENINKLKKLGYKFISPASGRLACGDVGEGKLADTKLIVDNINSQLYDIKDLTDKKVMVTAGPTISQIDPVRFITNRSTGKMGFAIAEEARDRGAEVTLISGPTTLLCPAGIELIKVNTNEEMYSEVVKRFDSMDIVIKSAAVADYKSKKYSSTKIKKGDGELNLTFIRDNDILKKLGEIKSHQVLVGFAAESDNLLENAKQKLEKKNLDFVVANDISGNETGFASNDNKVIIMDKNNKITSLEKMPKKMVARELFNLINS